MINELLGELSIEIWENESCVNYNLALLYKTPQVLGLSKSLKYYDNLDLKLVVG